MMMDRIELGYRKQNQFVSDASHELRTPISIIQGYIGLLDRWGKKDKAILDEAIAAIKSEGAQMKELVEKLLFLARSDRGQIELDMEVLDMKDIIDEVCKETRMIDTKHTIECSAEDDAPIRGSRKLVKQLIRIIVDNSIKFTPAEGYIRLSLKKSMKNIMIIIEDTGAGIPEEDIPHIFDRFYRSDKSRTKQSGGSGLGLSIAKWILDQHDADVLVTSKVGEGTRTSLFFKEHQVLDNSESVQI
jgi:signal transduction histidine kinase